MGYRYRLHRRDLPGKPDITLPSRKKIIDVRGCFWHHHDCSLGKRSPQSNAAYWEAKLNGNQMRDKENFEALNKLGWDVLILWECDVQTSTEDQLRERLVQFIEHKN